MNPPGAGLPLPRAGKERFPQYGWAILDALLARFHALPEPIDEQKQAVSAKIKELIEGIKQRTPPNVTWYELATLEMLLIQLEPDETLRRQAWSVRDRYRTGTAADEYAAYLGSPPPDPTTASVPALRADLLTVLSDVYYHHDLRTICERLRAHLSRIVAVWTVSFLLVALVVLLTQYLFHRQLLPLQEPLPALPWYVMLAGSIGGFVSVHRRIQAVSTLEHSLDGVIELEHGRITVMLAPLLGAIFALIGALFFISGYMEGDLFPRFITPTPPDPTAGPGQTFWTFITGTRPVGGDDVAKLLIWSFLAGFAERLIPDALDRLVGRAQAAQEHPAAPAQPDAHPGAGAANGAGGAANPGGKLSDAILSTDPAAGGTHAGAAPLVLRFKAPMSQVTPSLQAAAGTPITVTSTWDAGKVALSLQPGAPLSPGGYTLTLQNGTLADGRALTGEFTLAFTV